MQAIVQDRYGSPDVLEVRDVPEPVAGPGEVRVRVHAAAVNAYDWHVMRGDPYLARLAARDVFGRTGPRRPIRGRDLAGVVDAVGPGVTRWAPGDEVYGDTGHASGTFAEYVCLPADLLETKPAGLTFPEAAAVPLAANTALLGLRDAAGIRAGQRVLVNGASGGVGTFAVQIAKAYGAEVTAVCGTRNVDLLRSLGADRVVDYRRADFAASGERHDAVFDLVGNRSLADLRRVLTPDGTLVLSGGGTSQGGSLVGPMGLTIRAEVAARFARRQRLVRLTEKPSRAGLATLRDLVEAGAVRPVVERTYPLAAAADAIRHIETAHARAKIAVTVLDRG